MTGAAVMMEGTILIFAVRVYKLSCVGLIGYLVKMRSRALP